MSALQPPLVVGQRSPRQAPEGVALDQLRLNAQATLPASSTDGTLTMLTTGQIYKWFGGQWVLFAFDGSYSNVSYPSLTTVDTALDYLLATTPEGDKTLEFTISYGDPTQNIYTLPSGSFVNRVEVLVINAWNGVGAAISLGSPSSVGAILPANYTELSAANASFSNDVFNFTGSIPIQVVVTPGTGASAGSALIRLYITTP